MPARAPVKSKATKPTAKPLKAVKASTKSSKAVKPSKKPSVAPTVAAVTASSVGAAAVHIIGSKVCQAFKKCADNVTAAVQAAAPGTKVTVELLPAEGRKPDRGSFIVTANGATIVELRGMPRPFTVMKALDVKDVAARVSKALQ